MLNDFKPFNKIAGLIVFVLTISGCSKGGVISDPLSAPVLTTTTGPFTLTVMVQRSGVGSGMITSTPTGIDCRATCTASFTDGMLVTLTATPDAGSVFTGWAGGGCSGVGVCKVIMNADQSVGATFKPVDAAKQWGTPVLIETDNLGNAEVPQIAVDSSGNAIAVWRQSNGAWYDIWANRFDGVALKWGVATLIEMENLGHAYSPHVAAGPSGNVIAVWSQDDDQQSNIWANRFDGATLKWEGATRIETENLGDADGPHVAVDPSGNIIVVWYQFDGTQDNIHANRFDGVNLKWGEATLIETDNLGNAYNPEVVIDPLGNAIVVWYQSDGTRDNIHANRFDSGTLKWGTPTLVEIDNLGSAERPHIAVDPSGNAIAVWRQSNGTRYSILANRFDGITLKWGVATLIETNDLGHAHSPQVAVDKSGNAVVVWNQSDGNRQKNNIWANRFDGVSLKWGVATLIETDNVGHAYSPHVVVDPSGNAMVVWYQSDGTWYNTLANLLDGVNLKWGVPTLIEMDNLGDAARPRVGVDPSGNVIAVWSQSDGKRSNIWANRFE